MEATGATYLGYTSSESAYPLYGKIDEARISYTARSADWIKTEYNNQNATSTFYSLGSETSTAPPYTPTPANLFHNFLFGIGTREDLCVQRNGRWVFKTLFINAWRSQADVPWKGEVKLVGRPGAGAAVPPSLPPSFKAAR